MATHAWQRECLKMHNDLRARHHAPPLRWSDECFELASKQADLCAEEGCLENGNCDGRSGLHGQNLGNGASGTQTPSRLALSWYNELVRWVYNYEDHDAVENQMCQSFTQIVWFNTQCIGVAQSGDFVVANYFPAGNIDGAYKRNVLPAPMDVMAASFRGRTAWFRTITPDVSAFVAGLADCVTCSKSGDRSACITEVQAGCTNGGQVCFIRENGDVSTCVKKNFAINRFKRPLKPEFKTRLPKETEASWQKLPEVHTQFKEIAFEIPVLEARQAPRAQSAAAAAGGRPASQPAAGAAAGGSRPCNRRATAPACAGADAVHQVFARSDENRDGFLQMNELGNVMDKLGMNKKDAAKLLKAVDQNGDGKVDIAEFVKWIFSGTEKASSALSRVSTAASASEGGKDPRAQPTRAAVVSCSGDEAAAEQEVRRAFSNCDSNSDGFLQQRELEKLMEPTGMDKVHVQRLIKAVDKNGDGKVDPKEFLDWVFSGSKTANKTLDTMT